MWDDLFAADVEAGEDGGFASEQKTDGEGIKRTLTLSVVPAGALSDNASWVDASELGVSIKEVKPLDGGDKEKKGDAKSRGFKNVTGKRARAYAARFYGLDKPKGKKRDGKADIVETPDPLTNGKHTS